MKELKNKIDSIRRALKAKSIVVPSAEVESKILELCPKFPDDWCSDIRTEIIKALINDNQSSDIAPVQVTESILVDTTESEAPKEINYNDEIFQEIAPLESVENELCKQIEEEDGNQVNSAFTDVDNTPLDTAQASELTTVEDKSELVATTAKSMGIELHLSEIQNIASNVEYSGDSLDESIDDIRTAITTFVEYKAKNNQQKINDMISEVRATVSQRNQETSRWLNNGLSQIASDIKQGKPGFLTNSEKSGA
ncbi:hypothetical protein [Nostoc sp. FACHB-888]|uniref:hypothetical protein n=1 Tax=Nostoc sp. FACHB-888 TaxID=2692842 RepID=UPI001681F30B|nr:hypothetical protein [Nostoc sp. FACHB-888]MBD2248236.1 hypothetical protein [Nostoc sp. FACHB-888]